MRFSGGCRCCPCPADWETGFPSTLFATLTADCGGYNAEVIELTYNACLSAASGGARVYVGPLPFDCGNSAGLYGCASSGNNSLDYLMLTITCAEGSNPTAQAGFTYAALNNMSCVFPCLYGGINSPFSDVTTLGYSALDPVEFTLSLVGGSGGVVSGLCCTDEPDSSVVGSVHITE